MQQVDTIESHNLLPRLGLKVTSVKSLKSSVNHQLNLNRIKTKTMYQDYEHEPKESYFFREELSFEELGGLASWGRSIMIKGVPPSCPAFRFLGILQTFGEVVQYRLHRFTRVAHVSFRTCKEAVNALKSGIECDGKTLFPVPGYDYPVADFTGLKRGATKEEFMDDLMQVVHPEAVKNMDFSIGPDGVSMARVTFLAHYIGCDVKEALAGDVIGFPRSGPLRGNVQFSWAGTPMFNLREVPERFPITLDSFQPSIWSEIRRIVRRGTTVWVYLNSPASREIINRYQGGSITQKNKAESKTFKFYFA